jgi:alkylation response protein AidB-like acyl-CoA dehydrogenase
MSRTPVNEFLDDQEAELAEDLARLEWRAAELARLADSGEALLLDVLTVRAQASELALRAANSAVLHAGAKGYLKRHPAQRRLREAVFVAIVTPALKHLRKEIHDLSQARHTASAGTPRQAQAA